MIRNILLQTKSQIQLLLLLENWFGQQWNFLTSVQNNFIF